MSACFMTIPVKLMTCARVNVAHLRTYNNNIILLNTRVACISVRLFSTRFSKWHVIAFA